VLSRTLPGLTLWPQIVDRTQKYAQYQ
jgi:hypothetical protein